LGEDYLAIIFAKIFHTFKMTNQSSQPKEIGLKNFCHLRMEALKPVTAIKV
jgi:hypothetical protein